VKTSSKIAVIVLLISGFSGRSAWSQTAGTYTLKHRSEFSYSAPHNPFWPIGWVKGTEVVQTAVATEATAPITAENFVVTGISISSPPMALINNKECAEGEIIEAKYGEQTLHIKVLRINDGSVILQYQNKTYTIPFKHPTLSSDSAPKEEVPQQQDRPMLLH
jgi:hypothetical protein